jgi:hypothetical protein
MEEVCVIWEKAVGALKTDKMVSSSNPLVVVDLIWE